MSTNGNPWGVSVKKDGGDWEVCPEGNWVGRIAAMIDVGHHEAHGQDGSAYQRRTLILAFELAAKKKDGSAFFVARTVTLSLAQSANLYALVKTLSGEKKIGECFDPNWLANKGCLVQITHSVKSKNGKERTYANIQAVTSLPQGMTPPPGQCIVWSIFDGRPLPECSWIPPLYHEGTGAVKTVAEWVAFSADAPDRASVSSQAGDVRMPAQPIPPPLPNAPVGSFAAVTPDSDVPF